MSIKVELTYDMSRAIGVRNIELTDAATVNDVVRLTKEKFDALGDGASSDFAKLTRVAAVAVNGVLIRHGRGLKTPLASGDRVSFVKAAAGG